MNTINITKSINKLHLFFSVLSVEPDTITFNKDGKEIAGVIILKNITADKSLSYKVYIMLYFVTFGYHGSYLLKYIDVQDIT